MSAKPHQGSELATFVAHQVLKLKPRKSQTEIASEAGFVHPNMISMIKSGASKLPLDRVPSLAAALECDAAYLMRLALEQAIGVTAAKAVLEVFGTPVTENELGWLEEIRAASDNSNPRLTRGSRQALRAIFGK